jgi:hypothetical protein
MHESSGGTIAMLAAASSKSDRTLDTVRLVLLLESKEQVYPESLRTYFVEVIRQTVALLKQPNSVASEVWSEAISLALKVLPDHALRSTIEEILAKNAISPKQAEQVLETLETPFDTVGKPAHFSKEIYSTI